jgi:hypothetical protein
MKYNVIRSLVIGTLERAAGQRENWDINLEFTAPKSTHSSEKLNEWN